MAFFNPSNQLIQIDSGRAHTYLAPKPTGAINTYPGIGENQVLGQRYFSISNVTKVNPAGAPAIYMLVQMLATSAVTLAAWQTANAPAPVFWADNTFTTITPIMSEAITAKQNSIAGYWMPNYASLPNVTLAQLLNGVGLIQVAGYLGGAYGPAAGGGVDNTIIGATGSFQSAGIASGTASTYRPLGIQLTAVASGLCDVLVTSDII